MCVFGFGKRIWQLPCLGNVKIVSWIKSDCEGMFHCLSGVLLRISSRVSLVCCFSCLHSLRFGRACKQGLPASRATLAWTDHHYSVFKGWVGCVGVSYPLTGGARRNFGSALSKGKGRSSEYNMNFKSSVTTASRSCLLISFDGQAKGSSNPVIHCWLRLGTRQNLVLSP